MKGIYTDGLKDWRRWLQLADHLSFILSRLRRELVYHLEILMRRTRTRANSDLIGILQAMPMPRTKRDRKENKERYQNMVWFALADLATEIDKKDSP